MADGPVAAPQPGQGGGDPDPPMTIAEFAASSLPKWNSSPVTSKSALPGNPATNAWAAINLAKFKLEAVAFDVDSKKHEQYQMAAILDEFAAYLVHSGDEIIYGVNRHYRPHSQFPYTEAEVINGTRDVILSPLFEFARHHWFNEKDIDLSGLSVMQILFEELAEESTNYAVSPPVPPTSAKPGDTAQPQSTRKTDVAATPQRRIRTLRIDSIIALRPFGNRDARAQADSGHTMLTRGKAEDISAAEEQTPLNYRYIPRGVYWTTKIEGLETKIFGWWDGIKTVMALEFKRAGMLKKDFFRKLIAMKYVFGSAPTFTPLDDDATKSGVTTLCAILGQGCHYWVRYGPDLMVLCDYESTVILETAENHFTVDGNLKAESTNKTVIVRWMHIDNFSEDGGPTSRGFLAAMLYAASVRFKQFVTQANAAAKAAAAKKAEEEAKKAEEDAGKGGNQGRK